MHICIIQIQNKNTFTLRNHRMLSEVPQNHNWFTLNLFVYILYKHQFRLFLLAALHNLVNQHRTGVGWIITGGPILDEFFSTVSGLNFQLRLRHIYP